MLTAHVYRDGEIAFSKTKDEARNHFDAGALPLAQADTDDALANKIAPHVTYIGEKPYLTAATDAPIDIDQLIKICAAIEKGI